MSTAPGAKATSIPLLGRESEPTIFEMSVPGRHAYQLPTTDVPQRTLTELIPPSQRRSEPVRLADVSERDLVAHVTRLSHRQFSIDLGAYPLGSCTMKYNPKVCDEIASMAGLKGVHPGAPASLAQGWMEILDDLSKVLCVITGMAGATLQPAAGAAGELTGLLMMKAYHRDHGDERRRVIIPDSAHGTNPASVALAGYDVTTVKSDTRGLVDIEALKSVLDSDVAGIMLTNPNTLGLFEEEITQIADLVHQVGGLVYYDGANLNAIVGLVRPGDMGFDVVHMNLHKTFATPHGGGGPGAGPVAVASHLVDYLPGPLPMKAEDGAYEWVTPPRSIGRLHGWHGNAGVLARALAYIEIHGGDGLQRVAQHAVLNANWLRVRLREIFDVEHDRGCMHEVVFNASSLKKRFGVKAGDIAKALLEEGFHSPTVYFPLIVEEALMFEPTETESLQTLEALASSLESIVRAAEKDPDDLHNAPRSTPVGRVDEAKAARVLIPTADAQPR